MVPTDLFDGTFPQTFNLSKMQLFVKCDERMHACIWVVSWSVSIDHYFFLFPKGPTFLILCSFSHMCYESHIFTVWGRRVSHATQGLTEVALGNGEQLEAVGGRLCGTERVW